MNKYVILVWIFFINTLTIQAQTTPYSLIPQPSSPYYSSRPGNLFLLIPPDARTAGMGNTGIATNPDVTAIFYNPAKLVFTSEASSLHASYTPWFSALNAQGMFIFATGGYLKLNKNNALSASMRYFQYSNVVDVAYNNASSSYDKISYTPYELAGDISYSRKIIKGLSIGLTGKYTISNIQSVNLVNYKAANAIMGDFSIFYEKNLNYKSFDKYYTNKNYYDFGYDKFYASLVVSNIGGRIGFSDSLQMYRELPPTTLSFGLGYRKIINELNKVLISVEANKLLVPSMIDSTTAQNVYKQNIFSAWAASFAGNSLSPSITINAGLEYWYNDLIALRTGYTKKLSQGNYEGLTLGTSLRFYYGSIDAAFFLPVNQSVVSYHPLSNTVRIGFTFYFR